MQHFCRPIFALSLLLLASGCALFKQPDHFGARPVTYESLAGWAEDDHGQALATFIATCPLLSVKARPVSSGSNLQIPETIWQSLCGEAEQISPSDSLAARAFFERRFVPYRVNNNGNEEGLFTGYYEPTLYGSYKKGGDFVYPLYLQPPELAKSKPYFTQAEINHGALDNRHLELVYVDDPVMRFFLHIQGSGRVRLPDGKEIRVGYDGQNGHSYVGLGRIMVDEHLLPSDQTNFFTIRTWLYQHHDEAMPMMERNPSYVFFKRIEGPGPIGSAGAPLTPQRSLAVDSKYIPYGLPLFLQTARPSDIAADAPSVPYNRIMIAQDTGGAIRGPVRGDVFFGAGDEAEYLAGYMKGHGGYSILVPREIAYQLKP